MKKRRVYLQMKPLEEARRIFLDRFTPGALLSEEEIPSASASGRVTSRPVTAGFSSPSFHSAAMDGFAVRARDTFGADEDLPVLLQIPAQAVPVNTGQPLLEEMDAVVMIEHVSPASGSIEIRRPVYPWQNVRKVGEDIVATELLFPSLHVLAPYDLGALLSSGRTTVHVLERPRVTIIPTGSELVSATGLGEDAPPAGRIVESNSAVLAAMVREAGSVPWIHPIVPDEFPAIRHAILQAVRSDAHVVLLNAGSSAGSADYTVEAIEELGTVLVHGVTMMPGKPTVLGIVEGKPVVGDPGYPVSAVLAFEQFVTPLLHRIHGTPEPLRPSLRAVLARKAPSQAGIEEFRRVVTGKVGARFVAMPIKKGAGSITTLTRANGLVRIPASWEGVPEGDEVQVELLRPLEDIEKTLLCVGSHDLCLDLLRDALHRSEPAYTLASSHVGSLGGMTAINKGLAHMAGSHLLDPVTGAYNTTYIVRYIPQVPVTLVNLVYRQQGLMVRRGNPKRIQGVDDLTRDGVSIVNRQAGSGTRVLLDHILDRAGIAPERIAGYEREEYTHMAVAVDVLSGRADAGLGILAAARALDLDFVPLVEERYDLVIPGTFKELPMIQRALDLIVTAEFRRAVEALGGYSTRDTGEVFRP